VPIHVGVFSTDGVFDPQAVKAAGRPVFFNNNGIHPGEPEGIDACMALLRDLCLDPARARALGRTVLVYIPVYNVDGALNRQDASRVNQNGPEAFGFPRQRAPPRPEPRFHQGRQPERPQLRAGVHALGPRRDGRHPHLERRRLPARGDADRDPARQARRPHRRAPARGDAAALYAGMAQRGFPMCPT
jgi:hypothetical protein